MTIHFVTTLPAEPLEPNAIYLVENGGDAADLYVADESGTAHAVATDVRMQESIAALRGAANGYASLDGDSKLPASQMPTGSSPSEISSALAAKADASSVYTQAQVNSIETGLQSQIDGKQSTLANASELAKVGDGTFDGDPIIVLGASEW